jgi:hypothetical protein
MVYTWYFQDPKDLSMLHFESHGFERVQGRNCLHVEVDTVRGLPPPRTLRSHYWIDMERGGHPIQVEYHQDGQLNSRATIELESVQAEDGASVWFPLRGTFESFTLDDRTSGQPFFRQTIQVVPSSLRLNQGLPDTVFALNSKGGVTDTSSLSQARDDFLHPPPAPRFRTDHRGVQERLDSQLAEADRQSRRLDASDVREGWPWDRIVQVGLATFGILILGVAAFRRLKRS